MECTERIDAEITKLKEARATMEQALSALNIEYATKEAELREVQRQITANTWENTAGADRLRRLEIARDVLINLG